MPNPRTDILNQKLSMNVVLELDQVPIKTKITQILIEQVNEYPCVANCARDDIAQISLEDDSMFCERVRVYTLLKQMAHLSQMRAMLAYLEGSRHKVECSLAELEHRTRPTHPVERHVHTSRDKQGMMVSVLKVNNTLCTEIYFKFYWSFIAVKPKKRNDK